MNDHHIRNMMLQSAAVPPSEVWETVASTLDTLAADDLLQSQVHSLEVPPPDAAWQKVEQQLWEATLQQQLLAATEQPPAAAWQLVEAQLPTGWDEAAREQLLAAATTPPPESWPAIAAMLNNGAETKVIPLPNRSVQWFRWATAAAMVGLLLWGGSYLFTKSETSTIARQSQEITAPSPAQPQPTIVQAPATVAETGTNNSITETVVVKTKASSKHHSAATVATEVPQTTVTATITPFAEDQYLLVMNDEGEQIRVTRKIHRLACASDIEELQTDAAAALASKACYRQIKEWQQKMATTAALSSLTGFIDVNELIGAVEK